MPLVSAQRKTSAPAFELKGTIAPVTVLCLRSTALDAIEEQLRARIEPAPQMFANAPIVIDVADIEGELASLSLPKLVELLKRCQLIPVGVAHLPADHATLAVEHGLAVLQLGFGRSRGARATSGGPVQAQQQSEPPHAAAQSHAAAQPHVAPTPAPAPAPTPAPATMAAPVENPSLTVTSPIRGGQVVYAQRTDMVVLSAVNPGAQVIADGHIHVYGRLMGRALAGAHGRADARVFCHSLEAELVSVAGEFITAEDIPAKLRGKPAQIFVEHGSVRVLPL
jgi:septum site-determining protein MinC